LLHLTFLKAFLGLVRAQYWKRIVDGSLRPEEGRPLIMSVTKALSKPCYVLGDFDRICPQIQWAELHPKTGLMVDPPQVEWGVATAIADPKVEDKTRVQMLVNAFAFNAFIVLAIVGNALIVFQAEPHAPQNDEHARVVEGLFTGLYLVEAILRVCALRPSRYLEHWGNQLELLLTLRCRKRRREGRAGRGLGRWVPQA